MRTKPSLSEQSTRREFIGRGAAIAAGAAISPHILAAEAASKAKPNSVIHGVRVGVITYSYRGGKINSAEETLNALLEDGLSEVELMDGPIRAFAGIRGGGRRGRPGGPAAESESKPTDAEREAQLAKCRDLRKMYNGAGVNIHLHKLPFGQ